MTTAKPWQLEDSTPAHRFETQQLPKQIVTLLSATVPLPLQAPSLSCWWGVCNAAAPHHLLASVPKILPSSPSHLLMWCQSKLQHYSELVLSSLSSQPVPRGTFLWLPDASQEKPSWTPPMPHKLFYRQRSDHHFFCSLFLSFTLSLVPWLGEEKTPTPVI